MEFLNGFADLFLSNRSSFGKKLYVIFIVIALFLVIDFLTDFFTNAFNSQKIEQLEKIQQMLQNKNLDSTTAKYLVRKKMQIVERWDYRDMLFNARGVISNNLNFHKRPDGWYHIAHFLTSALIPLALGILCYITPFMGSEITWKTLQGGLLVGSLFIMAAVYSAFFFSFIPIFGDGSPNLVFNFILHTILWAIPFFKWVLPTYRKHQTEIRQRGATFNQ
ncbi:hypothetical protein [Dyadobacter sp. OTU695]|uniref:hypothetical protein n=1 Tax=Dyadobacter sp. OTU695 TaxID=3043860 RepID=UPI00313D2DD2